MCYFPTHSTVDVTVHQVIMEDKLKELHRASGGAWGGTNVDQAFEQFIADLVGLYSPVHLYMFTSARSA